MNIRVKVGDQTFEVEVGDLNARPIVAVIDGERFEVWPETQVVSTPAPSVQLTPPTPHSNPSRTSNLKSLHAPIPGVVISVSAEPGATVKVGDELCVLEAMKMKNAIRSARAGQVAAVRVAVGQTVKHKDVLIEYVD